MENEPEMIRQQMATTRTALGDKLEMLQTRAVGTVAGVSTAIVETAENVQDSVEEAVRAVREFAQETVETVKGACDLKRHVKQRPWTMVAGAAALGFLGGHLLHGRRASQSPSWLTTLGDTFHPELAQLKGLAVGTILAIVRDLVTQSVPEPMERSMGDAIDGITVKLGGQPVRGRLLPEASPSDRSSASGTREARGFRERSGSENFSHGVGS